MKKGAGVKRVNTKMRGRKRSGSQGEKGLRPSRGGRGRSRGKRLTEKARTAGACLTVLEKRREDGNN